tara:strand:- start:28725 stop:29264 length:540 start_codon:yes stop_codon:yes gene_type:complete
MGTGLIIIDVIIIAIVILPFALFINGSKKRSRQLRNTLKTETTEHNCKLDKLEIHGNYAIGVDTSQQKLFFHRKTETAVYSKVIDLSSVMSCKTTKETKRVKDKTKHYDVVEKIGLSFYHRNQNNDAYVEFYNNDLMILSDQLEVAQNWQDYLNQLLSSKDHTIGIQNQKHRVIAVNAS